jgi:CDP-glycerol glycerophosphotransferase
MSSKKNKQRAAHTSSPAAGRQSDGEGAGATNPSDALPLKAGAERDGQNGAILYHDLAELSRKTPKQPRVLFFGRPAFADNTKYLYLAAAKAAAGYEVIWCTWSKSLLAQLRSHDLRCFDLTADLRESMNLLITASVAVFCENPNSALGRSNVFSGCLAGAQKIQLWHGVSVKQLDLLLIPHLDLRNPDFRNAIKFATRVEHFLSTSSELDDFWTRAFGCTSLVRAGQPRNEVIVRPPTPQEMIGSELLPEHEALLHGDKRKFLLVPTWQRGQPMYISTPEFHQQLTDWADRTNSVVFVKSHPFFVQFEGVNPSTSSVVFLSAGVDVYPWMSKFDALITDYSSIMFDFLLTNRPIFTFETRTQVSYGFEPDYSLVPDVAFRYPFTRESFESVVEANLTTHPLAASQRELQSRIFETNPAHACSALLEMIAACVDAAMERNITVIHPEGAAAQAGGAQACVMAA